ncbi:MAG: FAD-dependent oxidoreductase [Alphaproteobacteria bacterium]|nr:FAD-dependent oxidoreductase [Alphaproteobacteria bacterium]
MKIAIIGAGISGVGAAYLLSKAHHVTVFEKNDYIGGHSRTIDTVINGKIVPVDTGFIVFNSWNYPNILGFFNEIGVKYHKSNMSFGVSINDGEIEYSSNSLFAQRKNIFSIKFLAMLKDIVKFNHLALKYIGKHPDATLQKCLKDLKMGDWFIKYYILAMGASIWSCAPKTILDFPATTFLNFFKNHGLLNLIKRPQWYSVEGGSREYIKLVKAKSNATFITNQSIKKIDSIPQKQQNKYKVLIEKSDGEMEEFDHAILCCHADEALQMINHPTHDEAKILGAFTYQNNNIIVHTDKNFMPRNKKCWSSWGYINHEKQTDDMVCLSYWMNNLQNLKTDIPIILTLNPTIPPKADTIIDQHSFNHPIFNYDAIKAQKSIPDIQGKRGLWFCGAYQRYGFHEDGLLSAVHVVKQMGISVSWQ